MGKSSAPYVDLHIHTHFSDGSLSPAEVVEMAAQAGVGLMAVADHEGFEGSRAAAPLCEKAGIRMISAAELESTHEGVQYHVLCYGADTDNQPLVSLAARSRGLLDRMSEALIEKIALEDDRVSVADYSSFERDLALGGWKALDYLMKRGLTGSPREGMRLYERYGVTYERAGFPSLDDLIGVIHRAGGRAVLAHPGHSLRGLSDEDIHLKVAALLVHGFDGIECYYPLHSAGLTKRLTGLCDQGALMITAGSDCHGAFGVTRVGEMDISFDQIDLRGL